MTALATTPPPTSTGPRLRSGGNPLTKLTVNLTPRAIAALDEAADINSESKTNAVNRALQAYAFMTRMIDEGWEIVLKDPKGGHEQRIQFI